MSINFSVIIPTHNREKFLKESMNSVINQTFKPAEIIVVDDLDIKSTEKIVLYFKNKFTDIKIKYLVRRNFEEFSSPASINLGVQNSLYEYIAILDDDDLWDSNYLEEVKKKYSQNDCEMTVCRFKVLNKNKFFFGKFAEEKFNLQNYLSRNPGVICSNVTIKKRLFIEVGGYDETLIESADRDLFIRINQLDKKISFIKFSLVSWRLHNQIVPNKNKRFIISNFRFIKKHRKQISFLASIVIVIKLFKRMVFNG